MTETKQTSTTKTDRRPDCVTEIRISSDTRRTSASRTVISAATTRNAPMTVRRTLSAPTS